MSHLVYEFGAYNKRLHADAQTYAVFVGFAALHRTTKTSPAWALVSRALNFEEIGIGLSISSGVAIISLLVAVWSVLYARRSAAIARQSNDIGRLNSLLSLRVHYLELLAKKDQLVKDVGEKEGAAGVIRAIAHIDSRLQEVNDELEIHYGKVFKS